MGHPTSDDLPTFVFEINAALAFATVTRKGKSMGHAETLRVTGAGMLEVKLKMPRDGHTTEVIMVLEGETIAGKFAEVVDADSGVYPILVSG